MSEIEDKNDQYKNMFMFQTGMTQEQYIQQLTMKQYLASYISESKPIYEVDLPIEAQNFDHAVKIANELTAKLLSEPFELIGVREDIDNK